MRMLLAIPVLLIGTSAMAQNVANGEKQFKQTCTACHSLTAKKESFHTGPALFGVTKRPGRTDAWLESWISDPEGMVKKKDALALQLLKENNNVPMTNLLLAMNGNDAAKTKAATLDIIAFLKQNDAGTGGAPADGAKKKKN